MSYKTFWEDNGIRWIFSGQLTVDDLLKCNQDLYKDPRFSDIEYEICDFRAVIDFPEESKAVHVIANMDMEQSKRNPNMKVAIIGNRLAIFGLTRMYQIVTGDSVWETHYFENEDDARAWIAQR